LLGGLPSLRASIGRMMLRKVDRLSCIRFGSARYSVPTRLIGEQVGLHTDDGRLLVILDSAGAVVAEHTLVAPGETSVRDEHYGGPRPAPQRAVRPKTVAEQQFCGRCQVVGVGGLGAGVGRDGVPWGTGVQAAGVRPVIWFQVAKRVVISRR
jgi:Mu transposase-like protein